LAISPPSDIVLDVARAADPADIRKAHAELLSRAGESDAPFEVAGVRNARASRPAEGADSFRRFEAMILQTFIQNMLPKNAEGIFGKGLAGDMWKARMSENIADVVAARGGIGIAQTLASAHYMAAGQADATGTASANPRKAELDAQLSMSSSLVHQLQLRVMRSLGDTSQTQTESRSK